MAWKVLGINQKTSKSLLDNVVTEQVRNENKMELKLTGIAYDMGMSNASSDVYTPSCTSEECASSNGHIPHA